MKKTMLRWVAVILTVVAMLTFLVGCGAKNKVKATISAFESSCQALDVRGMLACVDPTISTPILGAMDLFGVENTSCTLEQLVGGLDLFGDAGQTAEEYVQSIQIKPSDYAFNDTKDVCTVVAVLSYGDDDSRIITLKMILKDDSWYIADINF